MKLNAVILRKENEINTTLCTVDKIITLPDNQFLYFSQHLLTDFAFIADNADLKHQDRDGTRHCLLVMGETHQDGILVDSEGYNYARYAAFVPNVRELAMLEHLPENLRDVMEKAPAIADWLVKRQAGAEHGRFRISMEWLEEVHGIRLMDSTTAQDYLGSVIHARPEIAAVEFETNVLEVQFVEQKLTHEPEMEMS